MSRKAKWHMAILGNLLDELSWQAMEVGRVPKELRRPSGAYGQFVYKWRRKVPFECLAFTRLKRQIESVEFAVRIIADGNVQF